VTDFVSILSISINPSLLCAVTISFAVFLHILILYWVKVRTLLRVFRLYQEFSGSKFKWELERWTNTEKTPESKSEKDKRQTLIPSPLLITQWSPIEQHRPTVEAEKEQSPKGWALQCSGGPWEGRVPCSVRLSKNVPF
jgi:hypothetical protein